MKDFGNTCGEKVATINNNIVRSRRHTDSAASLGDELYGEWGS